VKPSTGLDPVIGQSSGGEPPQQWPNTWGKATPTTGFDFQGFVKMLGGEYFFAPSIGFLKSLA
jgi:hypothetical protein